MQVLSNASFNTYSINQEVDKPLLIKQWQTTFKHPPPFGIQTNLIKQVIGWQQQAKQ
jgi:hypothetical protein